MVKLKNLSLQDSGILNEQEMGKIQGGGYHTCYVDGDVAGLAIIPVNASTNEEAIRQATELYGYSISSIFCL